MSSNVQQESAYPPPPEGYESLSANHPPPLLPAPTSPGYSNIPPQQTPDQHVQHDPSLQTPRSTEHKTPQPRLRKACDSCSARKVKCDESGPPCRSCAALDIPCTFDRPSRRRGPPNKHAEAIKRQRSDYGYAGSNMSPTADAAQSLAALSTPTLLSAESICRIDILRDLIDDYFAYIHPLVPLPHEPTFRAAFNNRDDRVDKKFLALVAAMIAFLVSSFPRRPRQRFPPELLATQFPNAGAVIDRCKTVWEAARGPGYLTGPLNLSDALTSYLIGGTFSYMFDMQGFRLYLSEAVQIMRVLDLPKIANGTMSTPSGHQFYTNGEPSGEIDYVQQELSRRLFWVLYVGYATIHQFGSLDDGRVMPPQTPSEPFPPLPSEVDDAYIFPTQIMEQPAGIVSELAGFNVNARVLVSCNNLTALELAFSANNIFDWERHKTTIFHALEATKSATENIPTVLVLPSGTGQNETIPPFEGVRSQDQQSQWGQGSDGYMDIHLSKKQIQNEIQKANIYASQLATRSYLSEKFWNLNEARVTTTDPTYATAAIDIRLRNDDQQGPYAQLSKASNEDAEHAMTSERQDIFRDLAMLLRSVSQVSMEPNGLSFCHKIRAIASTLVSVPRSRMGIPSLDQETVQSYLDGIVDILNKLERLGSGLIRGSVALDGGVSEGAQNEVFDQETIEQSELVQWASLREHQERFIRENGFMGTL